MQIRNPENGYAETKSLPALWTILFGGLYIISCGLWAAALIWIVFVFLFYAWLGPTGTIPVVMMSFVYAGLAPSMIRRSYLQRGWVEEVEGGPETARKCPACAEIVRAEAVICRFCKTELPKLEVTSPVHSPKSNHGAYDALMMDRFGISKIRDRYYRDGKAYGSLEDAIAKSASVNMDR